MSSHQTLKVSDYIIHMLGSGINSGMGSAQESSCAQYNDRFLEINGTQPCSVQYGT